MTTFVRCASSQASLRERQAAQLADLKSMAAWPGAPAGVKEALLTLRARIEANRGAKRVAAEAKRKAKVAKGNADNEDGDEDFTELVPAKARIRIVLRDNYEGFTNGEGKITPDYEKARRLFKLAVRQDFVQAADHRLVSRAPYERSRWVVMRAAGSATLRGTFPTTLDNHPAQASATPPTTSGKGKEGKKAHKR